jgi:hypothetical protein
MDQGWHAALAGLVAIWRLESESCRDPAELKEEKNQIAIVPYTAEILASRRSGRHGRTGHRG